METKKRSLLQILRKIFGARSQLPFADTEAAISQLPESSWQEVAADEQSSERQEVSPKR